MSYNIPYSFIPGTKARAQEVNANFGYILDSLEGLASVKMNTTLSNLASEGIEVIKNLTCFRNIGEIIPSAIPLTDAGLHLLDGTLLSASGTYANFIDYIADLYEADPTADYFTTEANWQSAVTNYGVCGKFVYDSTNNTVRLPKYSNKIYTKDISSTAPVIGNGLTLGITDGTTNYGLYASSSSSTGISTVTNAYGTNAGTTVSGSTLSGKSAGLTTDPDNSGLITQLSNITTSLDGYYYIVVATSAKTDVQVDIDEIATDLNGKADVDLANLSLGLTNTICTTPATTTSTASSATPAVVTENYVNGTSWYRVYSDGWCEQGGYCSGSTSYNITFLKAFINTDYTPLVNLRYSHSGNICNIGCTNLATTGMKVNINDGTQGNNRPANWKACGYIR